MNFDKFNQIVESRLNYGEIEDASVVSDYKNVGCGDAYRIYLKIDKHNIIQDAKYTTTGCSFSLVSLGILCQLLKNQNIDSVNTIPYSKMEHFIDGYPEKRKNYIETAFSAATKAITDFKNGTGLPIETVITSTRIYKIIKEKGHLRGENLAQSMLENINLSGIDLSGANLQNAFLRNANLESCNLSNCKLMGTFFNNCNLQNANLQNSDLRFAKLTGANLNGTNFENALYDIGTKIDTKYIAVFQNMVKKGKDIYIKK